MQRLMGLHPDSNHFWDGRLLSNSEYLRSEFGYVEDCKTWNFHCKQKKCNIKKDIITYTKKSEAMPNAKRRWKWREQLTNGG